MMKERLFQFAAVTTLAAGMVWAEVPASGSEPTTEKAPSAHRMGHEQMMKALNLTPAQQQQAEAIFGEARQKAQPIRQEMRQNRQALTAAMKANNSAEIERLSAKQGTLWGKSLAIRTEAMAKFYTTLTPEQRTSADQMHQRMRSRMRQRMQERMQPGESESK
jgi:Spy/CpxP family protein refolding chaperone